MNIFISRLFKNIETNKKIEFNDIVKIHIQMPLGGSGFEKQHQSNIAIILGEPASGKTYQLREYAEKNQYTHFISLITLKENDSISEDTEVVLIDSIDEALTQNNQKTLARDLKEYILRCKKINPKVRFVISCRFLEWSEYFKNELQTVDKELREYEILPLSKEDIDNLLMQKSITSEDFWSFIDKNFLDLLFNNILITIYLIDNFRSYEDRKITYIDIYYDLSKRYLSEQGKDRENNLQGIGLDKFLIIASSLATYLLLNRQEDIESSNLNFIASELYKIDGEHIVASDLEIIVNSNLYKKRNDKFIVFHKSIQEYLMAYFITHKNLNRETTKELFSSTLRFYEEFEEVIVYLTNLKPELFDEFVGFDPFIFKRHPNLTKEQQEKLLLSILSKYKVDFSQMWGRWESFKGSTLVEFKKLDNIIEILQKHATLKEHGYYLMKLIENNYTNELKEYMFTLFEKNISDKKLLKKVVRENFIDNYEFNLSLYEFLKKYNLLEKDTHLFIMSFEEEFFSSLYGIKYKHKYGNERTIERTGIEFNRVVELLDFISSKSLKYIAPYILKDDTQQWVKYIKKNYKRDKYSREYIAWVMFSLLNTDPTKDILIAIAKFMENNQITFSHLDIDKSEILLNFEKFSDDFWALYFQTNTFEGHWSSTIINLFDISVEDIIEASKIYPIKNNLEKYVKFRLIKDVDNFLMQDKYFNQYRKEFWEKQKIQENEWELESESETRKYNKVKQILEDNTERAYNESKKKLSKIEDVLNIFNWLTYKNYSLLDLINLDKLDDKLKVELDEKYYLLIEIIKNDWMNNKLYEDDKFLEKEDDKIFLIYAYMFHVIDEESTKILISNESLYEKLFWYQYKREINKKCFVEYTNQYFDSFLNLSIERLKLTFKKNNNKNIGNFQEIIQLLKDINKFNNNDLKPIINHLLQINSDVYNKLNDYDRDYLLEVIILDTKNYEFVYKLMLNDMENCSKYLQVLLRVNTAKAMQDFFEIYNKTKKHKAILLKIKELFSKKLEILNKYDNSNINIEKRELYFHLMKAIKNSITIFEKIPKEYYINIFHDYYDFFSEYKSPIGAYSSDIYNMMHDLINNIWNRMESSKYIEFLKKLQDSKNNRLSDRAKYALTKAYEEQKKDGNYPNSYYKEIFDKEEKMDKTTININSGGNNIAINSKNINQNTSMQLKDKDDKWWLYSAITGLTTTLIIWWSYNSWYFAIAGGGVSFFIVWKLNPKFRFRNIGYALLTSGILSNIISFSGVITIHKNDLLYGIVKFGENNISIILIVLCIPFFILDYYENKK